MENNRQMLAALLMNQRNPRIQSLAYNPASGVPIENPTFNPLQGIPLMNAGQPNSFADGAVDRTYGKPVPPDAGAYAVDRPNRYDPRAVSAQNMQGGNFASMFAAAEKARGLPEGYLARVAKIESSMNPNAKNPRSSAGGLFQFINKTAEQYGLQNRYDPQQATDAAARLAADNRAMLVRALGREPSAGELYLAHQQGAGGAIKLLTNPNARAVELVGRDQVRLNGGNDTTTASQFASKWIGKVDGAGAPVAAQAPQDPGMYAEAPPQAMGMPSPRSIPPQASPAAPQPMQGPDGNQVYKVGTLRDPAGGGTIDNIATQPNPTGIMQGLSRDAQLTDLYNKLFGG